ncbi:MAG: hypothetical protein VXX15_04695, partial [Planctomycetota bacterium]|nr:hypothetical protein [Planctomycetota bacterium]
EVLNQRIELAENEESELRANLLLSNLLFEIGQISQAIKTLDSVDHLSSRFAAASIYMSRNQFVQAAEQYEAVIDKLPEEAESQVVSVYRPAASRPGLAKFDLPRNAIFEQYSECLARSERPAEAQAVLDRLPSPETDRDRAGRSLIQAMIYAGYSQAKFTKAEDGSSDEAAALQELESAKRSMPRDIGPHLFEASIYTERFRRTGDKEAYEAASSALTDAEALSPQSAAVATARFALLESGGDVTEGIRALVSQLERDPTNNILRLSIIREYLSLGDRVTAASVAAEGGRALPTGKLSAEWFSRAGELLLGIFGQELEARAYFRQAFDQYPTNTTFARQIAAEASVPNPDWRLVVRLTAKEEVWVEKNPDLLSLRATALSKIGREQESRTVLRACFSAFQRQVADGSPKLILSRYPLQLVAYFGDDQIADVIEFAKEVNGGVLSWPLLNGLARVKLNQQDFAGAIADANKSAEMATEDGDSEASEAWLVAGNIAIAADQPREAITAWEKSLSLNPNQPLTTNNIAYVLSDKLGEHAKALPLVEAAAAASPQSPQILDTLGTIQLALGEAEVAAETLATALRRGARALTHARYALALTRSGDQEQARLALSDAKARDDAQGDDFDALVKEVESILAP